MVKQTVYRVQNKLTRRGPFFSAMWASNATEGPKFDVYIYSNFNPPQECLSENETCWFKAQAFKERQNEIAKQLQLDPNYELVSASLITEPTFEDDVQVVF
jgi:hypothetical protein